MPSSMSSSTCTNYQRLLAATSDEQKSLLSAPVLTDVLIGNFSLVTYQQFLLNAFHHVRFTVPLMMATGAHIAPERCALTAAIKEYINEEYGHEHWVVQDLGHCGVSKMDVYASHPGQAVEVMVAYVRDYINTVHPLGFLGMVHVLEGTSTSLATQTAELVQDKLRLPDAAFTYLRSHGDLDIAHVDFYAELLDELSAAEMIHVIHVAKRVYALYGDVLRSLSDLEVANAA